MIQRSTTDPSFERGAETVLREIGEIWCLIRFSYSAGARSYEFFHDIESFRQHLNDLPSRTSVIVFRDRQLPLRGIVDDAFVATARHSITGKYWVVARMSMITMGRASWFHHTDGETLDELEEELRDSYCWGHTVAVGNEPDWLDLERTFEAKVPDPDGRVIIGIY